MLNKVGRKRGFRKDIGFPVAGPLGGPSTPARRNGTGPSRGKARWGYTSPIPFEIAWMRWVYLGRGPLVRPIEEKVSSSVLFRKVGVSGGGWAKNVALDIKTKLGELALQHQASAQHQHPKPKPDVVVSSSGPSLSGDDSH